MNNKLHITERIAFILAPLCFLAAMLLRYLGAYE